ncbi:Mce family protein MceF [Nocardia nova SH22a]|uniref:Mce family protein MceF n=1 Tax=Nocardia nova SH22a TaxID=1415166 RepID=W5TQG3_9NOCA|nr:MCE family protein [Nocardia nova]AHH19476.1 Mce family protein MceF [Nocardia nova SH22a]
MSNAHSRIRRILEPPARLLVGAAKHSHAHRTLASLGGLVLILLAGGGYLLLGALRIDPLHGQFLVRVELAESGGLLPGQDVTLHGVRIGRVAAVDIEANKVVATAEIAEGTRVPDSGPVRVAALSAAGEQYLDFAPVTDRGPYLGDGSRIPIDRTSSPTTLATMLGDLSGTLAQIDPDTITAIEHELGVSAAGPDKLAAIIDGGTFMISTLDSVLPQTVDLLHNSKTVLTTLGDTGPGLDAAAADWAAVMRSIAPKSSGLAHLVDRTPDTLTAMDRIIAENSPTMVQLLANLATVSQMSYLHVPALQEFFFPQQRGGSALDAITSAFHDGGVWALAAIYPHYSCDYAVPRRPGTRPDSPEPYLNAQCTDTDPSVLIRGADNAPRPPGDTTRNPPPGADPHATANPTPPQPFTIPLPYGGPVLPQPPLPYK